MAPIEIEIEETHRRENSSRLGTFDRELVRVVPGRH